MRSACAGPGKGAGGRPVNARIGVNFGQSLDVLSNFVLFQRLINIGPFPDLKKWYFYEF